MVFRTVLVDFEVLYVLVFTMVQVVAAPKMATSRGILLMEGKVFMKVCVNPHRKGVAGSFSTEGRDVCRFHAALPGYEPTPLRSFPSLADICGVGCLLVKDEGKRFGLKAFKALGASYAVYRVLRKMSGDTLKPDEFLAEKGRSLADGITFVCATDGNHGRAVAWIARLLGRPALIFMPEGSAEARIRAIESEGATVVVVTGGYDEAVRCAAGEGERKSCFVVADTGYPGYMEIPRYIQEGYLTMFQETVLQLKAEGETHPDSIFLQAGVGAFASAAALFFRDPLQGPRLVSVEPMAANCLFASAAAPNGAPRTVMSGEGTIMAGLNCETPSHSAWPLIRDRFDAFVSIEDRYAAEAMKMLAREGVVAGESGAAGLAALLALREENPHFLARELGIDETACVLLINTEADTDPEGYYYIVRTTAGEVETPRKDY